MHQTTRHVVFIHGLFMNPGSWSEWMTLFGAQGYTCHAPAFPYHEGVPDSLRKNPDPALAFLTFGKVIEGLSAFIDQLPEKPILIGHSIGGLAVQKLINTDKGVAGICIHSAPPQHILSFEWSFLKANWPVINPLRGNTIFHPTPDWFHYAFCHTMTKEESARVFDRYVVPESRNIPRSTTGRQGAIDFGRPHVPLLFTAGDKDTIIPASLNRKNFQAYRDPASRRDFIEFEGKTHYVCGQPGWNRVAEYCLEWLNKI